MLLRHFSIAFYERRSTSSNLKDLSIKTIPNMFVFSTVLYMDSSNPLFTGTTRSELCSNHQSSNSSEWNQTMLYLWSGTRCQLFTWRYMLTTCQFSERMQF